MTAFRVAPLTQESLPTVAAYLARRGNEDPACVVAQLRWRLFDNPATRPEIEAGQILVSDDGQIAGVNLAIPQRFLSDSGELLGLCASAFYVDESARMQGLLMFRRFLGADVDFHFATTCNALSAALWKRVGARPIERSRRELLLPIHAERVTRYVMKAGIREIAATAFAHAIAWPMTGMRRRFARRIQLTPTHDWERLAALAEQSHGMVGLTASRDVAFLQWRYERNPRAPDYRIWLVRDRDGHEGWVSAACFARPFAPDARSWMVTDAIWSGEGGSLLCAIAEQLSAEADLLAVRGRMLDVVGLLPPLTWRRTFPQAPIWVTAQVGATMDSCADFVPADGDTAP